MKYLIILSTTLFLTLFTLLASDDQYGKDLTKWSVVTQPDEKDWNKNDLFYGLANYSSLEWTVSNVKGKVIPSLEDDLTAEKKEFPKFDTTVKLQSSKAKAFLTLKVEDGWIAAYNRGEFGSAIYWFSKDGKAKEKLSEHQVNEFLIEGDRIFAVEGLAHLSLSRGSMIEIKKLNDRWKVLDFITLPASAEAITRIAEGDYLIVTTSMLLRVNLKKEIKILIHNVQWGALYPNSIAVDDQHVYIGMRQFIARCKISNSIQSYDLLVPTIKWLNSNQDPFGSPSATPK